MYQHCIPIKFTTYGSIIPHYDEENWLLPAYKWLSFHCGYCPQVWLARGKTSITGFRSRLLLKRRKYAKSKRKEEKTLKDSVLFEFDLLPKSHTFPVDYDVWCYLLGSIINISADSNKSKFDDNIRKELDESLKYEISSAQELNEEYKIEELIWGWNKFDGDVDEFVKRVLFVENNQVVVPSLNLKAAKNIFCRNEGQKKKLRGMGFIEDRIKVKNFSRNDF